MQYCVVSQNYFFLSGSHGAFIIKTCSITYACDLSSRSCTVILQAQYPWHWDCFFRKFHASEVHPVLNLSEPDWVKNKNKIWIIAPQAHLLVGQHEILNANSQVEKETQTFDIDAVLYSRKHPNKEKEANDSYY